MSSGTASGRVTVSVRLFASYAEVTGRTEVELSIAPGSTVQDLLEEFRRQVPAAAGLPARLLCAVNLAHVLPSHVLRDGDEVAILPPMAGG